MRCSKGAADIEIAQKGVAAADSFSSLLRPSPKRRFNEMSVSRRGIRNVERALRRERKRRSAVHQMSNLTAAAPVAGADLEGRKRSLGPR